VILGHVAGFRNSAWLTTAAGWARKSPSVVTLTRCMKISPSCRACSKSEASPCSLSQNAPLSMSSWWNRP
jgi:hypothetical protein